MLSNTLASLALLALPALAAPTQVSTASYVSPTASMAVTGVNMTLAIENCGTRMNGQLPPFVPTGFNYSGTSRQYFIKAEEIEWDYIPDGWDDMRGVPIADSPAAGTSVYSPSNASIGHKYIKGLFRGYTSSNFSTLSVQPNWLGFQGPIISAEVGDMVEVMVYNDLKIATHPVSMHSMGLHYSPTSEGALYYRGKDANGTAISYAGSAIHPGECFVYKWLVPVTSQPDANLPSKLWSYHGDINLLSDVMAGFFGPTLVYRRGMMETIKKTYKEYILFYATSQEYQSYYLNANVAKYMPQLNFTATSGAPPTVPTSTANETIWGNIYDDLPPVGSNSSLAQSFMAINGFAYSTMPTIEVCQDDDVIWHFWSMGSFNDGYHSAHAHGNNFQGNDGSYMAQITLLPASMVTVMMKAANVGLWQMLCHVAAHWQMGMNIQYNVTMTGTSPQCPPKGGAAMSSGMSMASLPTGTRVAPMAAASVSI